MNSRSAQEIWEAALGELQIQVSKSNYRTWLEKTIGISYQDNQFVVGVPNAFVAEYLDRNQRSLIEKTLIGLTRSDTSVIFHVNGRHHHHSEKRGVREEAAAAGNRLPFNPKYTFDSFVVGASNRLARDAALNVAQKPGISYNPLFIYGGVGLGKTHLLHALGHSALLSNMKVLYVTAEQFTNEFVNSIREKNVGEFQSKYRSVDMLLIDDIHFLTGKEQTEESFFHTFNELHNANRQIAITSNCPPASLQLREDRLQSRFEWGLVVDIQPPDRETRLSILESKVAQTGSGIGLDVMELIVSLPYQNIRQLEGALNRVTAFSRLVNSPLTPEIAAQALEDIALKQPSTASVTPELIVETVAVSFQLTARDLKGKKRDREIALARHLAMYLIREETGCSLAQVGRELGGRDHSTVTHAYNSIAGSIDSSPYLKRKLLEIQQAMRRHPNGGHHH